MGLEGACDNYFRRCVYVLCHSFIFDIRYIIYTYIYIYMHTCTHLACLHVPRITVCDTDFFMSGGSCLACPAGSSRQTNDDSGSCGCNGGMVTSGGSISTSDVPCDSE